MSRGRQYIEFEGLFSESVLGIFRIIRGFADLRDLAAVSVPYKMEASQQAFRVVGHQRIESDKHAQDIKNYLEQSGNRFPARSNSLPTCSDSSSREPRRN